MMRDGAWQELFESRQIAAGVFALRVDMVGGGHCGGVWV
jgi:hypothetical protein